MILFKRMFFLVGGMILFPLFISESWGAEKGLAPTFDGLDAKRTQYKIRLTQVGSGFDSVTEIKPFPLDANKLFVLQKTGTASLLDLKTGKKQAVFKIGVRTSSEEGLLGAAFHPDFKKNSRFYLFYTPKNGPRVSRVAEWVWPKKGKPQEKRLVIEVPQPYGNHNGGGLAMGPDGKLYAGFGDGGAANDPHDHGQNEKTKLGTVVQCPTDSLKCETFSYGWRNPWRISFTDSGDLIVGDVGQNKWEEITISKKGANHGWNVYEGTHCFEPKSGCAKKLKKHAPPIYEYGRDDGLSVTGGYVIHDKRLDKIRGHYVFGDFGSGKIWALDLKTKKSISLGSFPISPATFGRDTQGRLYVGAFSKGGIYRFDPH